MLLGTAAYDEGGETEAVSEDGEGDVGFDSVKLFDCQTGVDEASACSTKSWWNEPFD